MRRILKILSNCARIRRNIKPKQFYINLICVKTNFHYLTAFVRILKKEYLIEEDFYKET